MKFRKMHGLGNDFVILDAREQGLELSEERIVQIADRHFGVGCDQLIIMEPSGAADLFMRIYNPDGSQSGACGNATRCVADIMMTESGQSQCSIETLSGVLPCERADNNMISVDMGAPKSIQDSEMLHDALPEPVLVDMGNPHCVFFVEDLKALDVKTLGAQVEHHKAFPNRTNAEFVEQLSTDKLRQRTWERGAGLTNACGSGACAVAMAAYHKGLTGRKAEIVLDGGSLFIEIREDDGHILMAGPIAYAFEGKLSG